MGGLVKQNAAVYTSGNTAVGGSAWQAWPDYWRTYPTPWVQPSTINVWSTPSREEGYANEVEVERGDYDAVLRFYRSRERSRTLVKEITVPLGVLDWLEGKETT